MPIFIRLVRAAMALAIASGADRWVRSGAKWISASHMTSRPQRSAPSTCAIASSKALRVAAPRQRGKLVKHAEFHGRTLLF